MLTLRLLFMVLLAISASPTAVAQRASNPAVQAACREDVHRLCSGVQPGGGRIRQCMKEHRAEVSPGCVEAVRAARQGAKSSGAEPFR
jgi:hypothetical protein